jgi:hypothetical protein
MKLPKGRNKGQDMERFAEYLKELDEQVGFAMSARGWGYLLEGEGMITKAEIDRVEGLVNECRELGLLPIDFTADEAARQFDVVDIPCKDTPIQYMKQFLEATMNCQDWYQCDWWDGEKYYIQMLVEKIDLKSLFKPICEEYHIPISTSKGWSSMRQRAEYARRFKEAEELGLTCVLLYCGDYDPDGLRISDFIRSNLDSLINMEWKDGEDGYDPENLIIDRFGLNYDFIINNNLTWIDNLITGSGKNLASPAHPNNKMTYVQDYLVKVGARKCEANALVKRPDSGRELCRREIEKYIGPGALKRFELKRKEVADELTEFRDRTGISTTVEKTIELIDSEE